MDEHYVRELENRKRVFEERVDSLLRLHTSIAIKSELGQARTADCSKSDIRSFMDDQRFPPTPPSSNPSPLDTPSGRDVWPYAPLDNNNVSLSGDAMQDVHPHAPSARGYQQSTTANQFQTDLESLANMALDKVISKFKYSPFHISSISARTRDPSYHLVILALGVIGAFSNPSIQILLPDSETDRMVPQSGVKAAEILHSMVRKRLFEQLERIDLETLEAVFLTILYCAMSGHIAATWRFNSWANRLVWSLKLYIDPDDLLDEYQLYKDPKTEADVFQNAASFYGIEDMDMMNFGSWFNRERRRRLFWSCL